MTRAMKFALGLIFGAALVALGAADASADHFIRLSKKHIIFGYGQLNFTNIGRADGRNEAFKLVNPIHVDQIAAVFVYQRPTLLYQTICVPEASGGMDNCPNFAGEPDDSGEVPYEPEVFLGCLVKRLTPHGAIGIDSNNAPTRNDEVSISEEGVPRFLVTIWAPVDKVDVTGLTKPRRKADGLGGRTVGSGRQTVHQVGHPGLFSLPSNDVVSGQREEAIDCVCERLAALSVSRNTFNPFGIACP